MATQTETKMKALHYDGPFKVSVKEIDLPKIEHPDDGSYIPRTHLFDLA